MVGFLSNLLRTISITEPNHTLLECPDIKVSKSRKQNTTAQDGQQITQNILGEHKVVTTEQQFLVVILSFSMHLRWPWLLRFYGEMLQKLFKLKIIEI